RPQSIRMSSPSLEEWSTNMQDSKKINPLIALAAISVTLFSLVGIAVMTGVMPSSFSKKSEAPLETATPKVQEPHIPAKSATASGEIAQKAAAKRTTAQAPAQPAATPAPQTQAKAPVPPAPAPAPLCSNCGVVTSVDAIKQQGEGSGLGAVAGGVVGG